LYVHGVRVAGFSRANNTRRAARVSPPSLVALRNLKEIWLAVRQLRRHVQTCGKKKSFHRGKHENSFGESSRRTFCKSRRRMKQWHRAIAD
jgi:hypothetical protein